MIGKQIGNYVIERPLAQGGMGVVFVARHQALGRQAAIKFVGQCVERDSDTARRFLDEACITASLQHPNIVTIFDYGEVDGRLYYVMELLTGSDLATLMGYGRRFDIEQIRDYLDQICAGLHAAHTVGVVHRDLKPSNIFVIEAEPLRIKLMDFGIAKVILPKHDHTGHGQIIGTPRYMSPEQALGQIDRISPRTDIYSLGIILYEMLTGVSLFDTASPMQLLMMQIEEPAPKVRNLAPEVPVGIADLVGSCLAKLPNERPQSALEVAERFAEALSHPGAEGAQDTVSPSVRAKARTEQEAAAAAEASALPDTATRTLRMSKADRAALNRLWFKMQRNVEFPAFARTTGGVGARSDFETTYFSGELGDAILTDQALTTKLLRIVNSAYANRFSNTVSSVHHAIVILGNDRIRSIALSIALFENQGGDAQTLRVSASAISSLISGEIAQQFAPYAQVSDAEQAMLCGMFHNFGQHLAIVYLPKLYDQILALSVSEHIDLDHACERIVGLSLRKLGLGVGERWHLPKPLLGVMSNVPGLSGRWAHEEDRMVALAEFSNALCQIIASDSVQTRPLVMARLLLRYNALLTIEPATMVELLKSVQESFERRYASLLGLDSTRGSFSRDLLSVALAPESRVRISDTGTARDGLSSLPSLT
ncbi:MAG TPA: HDOD domain-containing protein, partial [Polyangiaceae bacterium]